MALKRPSEIYCRGCIKGPMKSINDLSRHIQLEHMQPLESRLIQMRKTGSYFSLVDPLRTCFQCYTMLDDHFAFQVSVR